MSPKLDLSGGAENQLDEPSSLGLCSQMGLVELPYTATSVAYVQLGCIVRGRIREQMLLKPDLAHPRRTSMLRHRPPQYLHIVPFSVELVTTAQPAFVFKAEPSCQLLRGYVIG